MCQTIQEQRVCSGNMGDDGLNRVHAGMTEISGALQFFAQEWRLTLRL